MRQTIISIVIFMIFVCASYAQEKPEPAKQQHEMPGVAVKEVDAFHELLHPLVHEAYPAKDFAAIKKGLPGLVDAAVSMKKASLPPKFAAKKNLYKKHSKKLHQQLTSMNKMKSKLTDDELGKRFMEMHDTFESIMGLMN